MKETKFEKYLVDKIHREFPGSFVIKTDPSYLQGFPDRLILYNTRWACFEVKRTINSPFQPNQQYYIDLLNQMSFATVVSPETQEDFFDEIQRTLRAFRSTRVPKR